MNKRSHTECSQLFLTGKNKRGISSIVATVLIILGSILLAVILSISVSKIVNNLNRIDMNVNLQIITDEGYTIWDPETRLATVQVARGADESDVVGFDMIFSFDGSSVTHFILEIPGINSKKVYAINLSGYSGNLTSIKIIPIFIGGVAGTTTSEVTIGSNLEDSLQRLVDSGTEFVDPTELSGTEIIPMISGGSGGGSSSSSSDESSDESDGIDLTPENCGGFLSEAVCDLSYYLYSMECLWENGECVADGAAQEECEPVDDPCGSMICGVAANGTCGTASCGSCSSGYYCSSEGTCVDGEGIYGVFTENFADDSNIDTNYNSIVSSGLLNPIVVSSDEYVADSDTVILLHLNGDGEDSSSNNELSSDKEPDFISDGRFLGAASFDGEWGDATHLYYDDNDNQDLGTDEDFSVSLWFRKTTENSRREILINDRSSLDGWDVYMENNYLYVVYAPGAWHYMVYYSDISGTFDDEWHNIVVTFDRDGDCDIYIDTELVKTQDITSWAGDLSNSVSIKVGRGASAGSSYEYPFSGDIDELLVTKKLLSESEINEHYNDYLNSAYVESYAFTSDLDMYSLDEVSWASSLDNFILYVSTDNTNWVEAVNGEGISATQLTFPSKNLYYRINFLSQDKTNLDQINFNYNSIADFESPEVVSNIVDNYDGKIVITTKTDEISYATLSYSVDGGSAQTIESDWNTRHIFTIRGVDVDSEVTYSINLEDSASNSGVYGPYSFYAIPLVSETAGSSVSLDFSTSNYIYDTSLFGTTCDSAGCYPSVNVRDIDMNIEDVWHLDYLEDGITEDEADNSYDLTAYGDVVVLDEDECVHGFCLDFSGEPYTYVKGNSPFGDTLQPNGDGYTISFWIYPRDTSGYVWASFYSSGVYFSSGSLRYMFQVLQSDGETVANYLVDIDASTVTNELLNNWNQLTYRFDPDTQVLAVFVNGELFASKTLDVLQFRHGSNQKLALGNMMAADTSDYPFDGKLDEFVIYNTALSDSQILELYETEVPPTTLAASFMTKELSFNDEIYSFTGSFDESISGGDTIVQFSTDGGYKWCDFDSSASMDASSTCYFPTDTLMFRVYPDGNSVIRSIDIQTNTDSGYTSLGGFPLGVNLDQTTYWTKQILYSDAMKHAYAVWPTGYYPWGTTRFEIDSGVYDEDSWPLYAPMDLYTTEGVLVEDRTFRYYLYLHTYDYPYGEYNLRFEGNGTVQLARDAPTLTFDSDGTTGESSFYFTVEEEDRTGEGIYVTIARSDVNNPVRNVQVIIPGQEDTYDTYKPFNTDFLDLFDGFEVFRYMDQLSTNGQTLTSWDEVVDPDYYSQTTGPASPEYLIELANVADVDPWFCIPHLADDEYVENLAHLIHENMSSDHKVYVEYSNEIWNSMFDVYDYATEMGEDAGYTSPRNMYAAQRSFEIFKIFEDEFEGETDRVVNVLGGLYASTSVLSSMLSYQSNSEINPYGMQAEAIAIAPYFNVGSNSYVSSLEGEDYIDEVSYKRLGELLLETIFDSLKPAIESHQALADEYGVTLIAYEGGQHLGYGLDLTDPVEYDLYTLYSGFNRDDIMGDLINELYQIWGENSDGLFTYFNSVNAYTKNGYWGIYEDMVPIKPTAKSEALEMWTDARD